MSHATRDRWRSPSCPVSVTPETFKMFHTPGVWADRVEVQAKKKLEFTERLVILLGQTPNLSKNRAVTALLSHIRDNNCLQVVCTATLGTKGQWLQHIEETDQQYSLYKDIACNPYVPLLGAIKFNRSHALKTMLEMGLDVNGFRYAQGAVAATPLEVAIRAGHEEMLKMLLEVKADCNLTNSLQQTPLHATVLSGEIRFAQMLLDSGCDPDKTDTFGQTVLHCVIADDSVQKVNVEMVHVLLSNGADGNIKDRQTGLYPLHLAISKANEACCEEVVRTLLQHKVNVNLCTAKEQTPLHFVASHLSYLNLKQLGHKYRCQLASLLLDHGADPDAEDEDFNTPLHYASQCGYAKLAEILLAQGANPTKRNIDGNMPVDLAAPNSGLQRVLQEGMDMWKNLTMQRSRTNLEEKWQCVLTAFDEFESNYLMKIKEKLDKSFCDKCGSDLVLEKSMDTLHVGSTVHDRQLTQQDSVQFDFCCLKTSLLDLKCECDSFYQIDSHLTNGTGGNGGVRELPVRPVTISVLTPTGSPHLGSRPSSPALDTLTKACQTVSNLVGYEWKALFRELSPSDHLHTESLIRELESRYPGQLREQAFQSLSMWREMVGKDAGYLTLSEGLRNCSLVGIVHVLEDRFPIMKD